MLFCHGLLENVAGLDYIDILYPERNKGEHLDGLLLCAIIVLGKEAISAITNRTVCI